MTFDELVKLVSSEKSPAICMDSRQVKDGDIFLAVTGTVYDGHDFIDQAVTNGAKYIVAEKRCECRGAELIVVPDSAEAAGLLAQANCGNPGGKLTNLAVTGTNGKTTVAFLVQSVIQKAGDKCGLIGTIFYDTGAESSDASLTTPDALTIAKAQGQMVKSGVKYMVTEASSHALSQNRLAGIEFAAAAFTNLTGDHLDYHKTETDYLADKSLLFEKLSPEATAVLNSQSPHADEIAKKTNAKKLWYAIDEPAEITAHIESMDIRGSSIVLEYGGQKQRLRASLPGRHNVSNLLAAAGLCVAVGFDLETVVAGLSALKLVPGRLEKLDCTAEFSVLIDYAHTDDALKNVLTTLKPLCKGKLIVVFGCGGDRDKTKRPRMAAVAEQLADIIVVTSDNPRTEHPAGIIGEIATGFEDPVADTVYIEMDRKKAINLALKLAKADDIVLIAGKGHETYQIIGEEKIDFNDKEVAGKWFEDQR